MRHFGVAVPIHVIRNGIKLAKFAPQRSDGAVTGIYVGRLAAEKNIPLMLDALVQICNHDKNIQFQLVGHGPLYAACQQKIAKNGLDKQIHLEGWVRKEQVPELLARADFQISMSVSEVHPLGIIEGMAAQLPAVVLADPAMVECVGDGALVAENRADWIQAVQTLSRSAELRRSLGAQARQQAEKYSIDQTIDQTLKLYHQLIGRSMLQSSA
jgi:glycosyltransferase involved in cell wall biosynthesis